MFTKELKTLKMTPNGWKMLSLSMSEDEYRMIVVEYQKRENEERFSKMPRCKKMFGVCRYWNNGRCGYCGSCKNAIHKEF